MAQTEQQAVTKFHTYLKEVYKQQPPPCITEWPLTTDEDFKYIDLDITLIENDHSEIVHLDEIFQRIPAYNRGRVLLQGFAGSGKTTLVWKASKKWASSKSFTEFELFIKLELNDPDIQEAKILEDIVPCLVEDDRRQIASYITKCDGKKVAFMLDGWDQFQQCQDSYIIKLVRGEVLTSASVLVTSRNQSLCTFHSPATMVLSGFTRDQISQLLKSIPLAPAEFQTLFGLCSHPLNAAIVSYVLDKRKLLQFKVPSTNTRLMMYFMHHCLLRYVHHEKDADIYHVNFQQLLDPAEQARFSKLCDLAFNAVEKQKTVFTSRDLQAHDIDPENSAELLGLIRNNFRGYYEFNHQTIQELLAAYCIHHMYDQQNPHLHEYIKYLLKRDPTTMVVPFCAGLSHPAFKDTLHTILDDFEFPDSNSIMPAVKDGSHPAQCKRLLTVVKAIYEAQSPELCTILAERADKFPIHVVHKSPSLTFWHNVEEPQYYLQIGYFLANITSLDINICVDFGANTFHTFSAGLFAHYLLQAAEEKVQLLKIDLNLGKEVEKGAVAVIAKLICKTSLISGLRLGWYHSETNAGCVLSCLIESIFASTSLKSLYFRDDLLRKQHVWYLILLISCSRHLKRLHLGRNYHIGIGVSLLAIPLKQNNTLTHLNLSECGVGPSQLRCLQESLKTNSTLEYLNISFNPFSVSDLFDFLQTINNSGNPSLQVLVHSHRFTDNLRVVIEAIAGAINFNRAIEHLPELRLPHASLQIPGRKQVSEFYKQTPFIANVNMMASVIDEVDEPGSTHGEPPPILDVMETVLSAISSSTGAQQSDSQTFQTLTICEDSSGTIHINTQ